MDNKKYCIVCGCENFSRSKMFCSKKCGDRYWFQQYYKKHKEEVIEKNKKWQKDNPEKANASTKKWLEKKKKEVEKEDV